MRRQRPFFVQYQHSVPPHLKEPSFGIWHSSLEQKLFFSLQIVPQRELLHDVFTHECDESSGVLVVGQTHGIVTIHVHVRRNLGFNGL